MALESTTPFPGDGETVHTVIEAVGATLSISDQRMRVWVDGADTPSLDMGLADLRRIQFDVERDRPATFVIVPLHVHNPPQVLAIPASQYDATAIGLAKLGAFLASVSDGVGQP